VLWNDETRELLRAGERLLARARDQHARAGLNAPRGGIEGVFGPEGALRCMAPVTAAAYALVSKEAWPDLFVFLGSSRAPCVSREEIATPLGRIPVDRALVNWLSECLGAATHAEATLEAAEPPLRDLSLLQVLALDYGRSLRVVVASLGSPSPMKARALGRLLCDAVYAHGKRTCVIVNGDLTHLGEGAGSNPAARETGRSISELARAAAERDRRTLRRLCALTRAAPSRRVNREGPLASPSLNALLGFVGDDGAELGYAQALNGSPLGRPARRVWRPGDAFVTAASVVFPHGGPRALQQQEEGASALTLCPNVLVAEGVLHLCDGHPWAFSPPALKVVRQLVQGHDSMESLARGCGGTFSRKELTAFVEELRARGLLDHPPTAPSDRARQAEAALKWSMEQVPFYAHYPDRLADAPLIDASTVRAHWGELTRPGAERILEDRRKTFERYSSGSSAAARLRSVVEREVADRRRGYENIVTRGSTLVGRTFLVSRPENLELDWRGGVSKERGPGWLAVTPGPDPSSVGDAEMDRVVELLVREDPERLEGDPAYLSALARRCLVHGVALPRLSQVIALHAYCWRLYADPIERAFRLPVRTNLSTSEFGTIALTCDDGQLHLVEAGLFFEILARGRAVREGEVGALAVTTLDTTLRPLIRYLNGDLVRWISTACRCGRPYRVIAYEGRLGSLLADRRGQPVTYRDLDDLLGVPAGVRYFRLRETNAGLLLELAPSCREIVPVTALRARLEERLGQRVRARFVDSFGLQRGKLLVVETRDRTEEWRGRFLRAGRRR
jgi:AmmeMemoRadiSam system protein B